MDELGITAVVLPELEALRGVIQNPNHHLDVHGHTLAGAAGVARGRARSRALRRRPRRGRARSSSTSRSPTSSPAARRSALPPSSTTSASRRPAVSSGGYVTFIGHDRVGAEIIAAICKRLRTSRKLSAHLQAITEHHLRLGFLVRSGRSTAAQIYEYLRATEPVSADVTLLTVADRLSARGSGPVASPEMVEGHLELAREMLGRLRSTGAATGPSPRSGARSWPRSSGSRRARASAAARGAARRRLRRRDLQRVRRPWKMARTATFRGSAALYGCKASLRTGLLLVGDSVGRKSTKEEPNEEDA